MLRQTRIIYPTRPTARHIEMITPTDPTWKNNMPHVADTPRNLGSPGEENDPWMPLKRGKRERRDQWEPVTGRPIGGGMAGPGAVFRVMPLVRGRATTAVAAAAAAIAVQAGGPSASSRARPGRGGHPFDAGPGRHENIGL